jgi:hypothetical protein
MIRVNKVDINKMKQFSEKEFIDSMLITQNELKKGNAFE